MIICEGCRKEFEKDAIMDGGGYISTEGGRMLDVGLCGACREELEPEPEEEKVDQSLKSTNGPNYGI